MAPSPSSNDAPNGNGDNACYQDLLEQIGALKSDVQSTVNRAAELKEKNRALQDKNEESKARFERSQIRKREARDATLQQLELMRRREKDYNEAEGRWKIEIESLRKENDATREEIAKTNISTCSIRQQIRDELQQKHDGEVSRLRDEMEKLRDDLLTVRRERETYKAECEHIKATAEQNAESLSEARSIEVSALKDVIKNHIESTCNNDGAGDGRLEDEVRTLKIQVVELTASNNGNLMDGNDNLRTAMEKIEQSRQSLVSSHQQELSKVLALQATVEADKRRALHQNEHLEQKLREETCTARKTRSALLTAEEEVARLRQLQSNHEKDSERMLEQVKADGEVLQQRLLDERDELQGRVQSLEESLCNVKPGDEVTEQDEALLSDARYQLMQLQHQCAQLEHKVFLLEGERNNIEAENRGLKHACDTCKLDHDLAQQQKEVLAKQCSAAAKKVELLTADINKLKTEVQQSRSELKASKKQVSSFEESYQDIAEQKEALESKVERLEQDLLSAREQYQAQISELKEKVWSEQRQLKQESRRGEMYKQKALEAHQKTVRAKEALSCLSLNVSAVDTPTPT